MRKHAIRSKCSLGLKINLQKQRHLRIPTERKRVHVSSLSPRRHFSVGFSLYDVYERFRHRMISRLVFPSNKHFEYSQRFASLRTCYWQHSCSGCDLPPVNTLFQPAIDHSAPRRLEAVDHAEGIEETVSLWNILFVIR